MSSLGALLYILVYILSISFYFVKELHCVTYRDQLTMFPITSKTIRSCQTEEEILFYKPIPNKTLTSKDLTVSPVSLYELTKLLNTVIPCELRIMRGNFGSLHHDMALKKKQQKKKTPMPLVHYSQCTSVRCTVWYYLCRWCTPSCAAPRSLTQIYRCVRVKHESKVSIWHYSDAPNWTHGKYC